MRVNKKNKFITTKEIRAFDLPSTYTRRTENFFELKSTVESINENDLGNEIHTNEMFLTSINSYDSATVIIIPKNAICYISDDFRFIYPELYYRSDEKLKESEKTNLSELYKYGVDVYTKNGERYKVTSEEYDKDDVLGIFVDDNTIMSSTLQEIPKCKLDKTTKHRRFTRKEAKDDMNGQDNTRYLFDGKLIEDNWYIPSLGEFIKLSNNLCFINISLKFLGYKILDHRDYKTSTLEFGKINKTFNYCFLYKRNFK